MITAMEKKGAVSCLYRTDDRTGHWKFRLDCRIKKKAKDWPLSATSAHNVSVFPVSIPPEDLPSKKTWHLAMMMAWPAPKELKVSGSGSGTVGGASIGVVLAQAMALVGRPVRGGGECCVLLVNLLALLEVASAEGSQDTLPLTPLLCHKIRSRIPVFIYMKIGSGSNLVTGCAHQAMSGTKIALAALGCDQTLHYHDVIMEWSPLNRPGTKGGAESLFGCNQMCLTATRLSGWSG
ncbi:hypothetical protein EMCRGX_G027307 [Ephydatia muelleri]